jgi:hypothetical protein
MTSELQPKAPDPQLFYQSMYKEERDQARQHEALRQQSTTLIFALSGVISTATGAIIGSTAIPLLNAGDTVVVLLYSAFGIFVAAIGWFGRKLSYRHFELSEMHFYCATQYRLRLQSFFPDSAIKFDEQDISGDAYKYWMNLYFFVMALGLLLTIVPIALIFWHPPLRPT